MTASPSHDPVLVLSSFLKRNLESIQARHGFIVMVNPDRQSLTVEYGVGLGEHYVGRELRANDGIVGLVFSQAIPQIIENYPEWHQKYHGVQPRHLARFAAAAATPVFDAGKVVGVITFIFETPHLEKTRDLMSWLLKLSESASAAFAQFAADTDNVGQGGAVMSPPVLWDSLLMSSSDDIAEV